jgi:hypothetical protein
MLDEYIRRTGLGVDVPNAGETDLEDFVAVNNKNKIYTGISVHGQKRLDLARQNDPESSQSARSKLFLWSGRRP